MSEIQNYLALNGVKWNLARELQIKKVWGLYSFCAMVRWQMWPHHKLSSSSQNGFNLSYSAIASHSPQWVTLERQSPNRCKFTSNFMDLKTLKIAWTRPWRRCRFQIGLIRWSTGCRTAWVVRHCWLLVCLAHLHPTILWRNINQGSFTLSVRWAALIFFFHCELGLSEKSSIWFCR